MRRLEPLAVVFVVLVLLAVALGITAVWLTGITVAGKLGWTAGIFAALAFFMLPVAMD